MVSGRLHSFRFRTHWCFFKCSPFKWLPVWSGFRVAYLIYFAFHNFLGIIIHVQYMYIYIHTDTYIYIYIYIWVTHIIIIRESEVSTFSIVLIFFRCVSEVVAPSSVSYFVFVNTMQSMMYANGSIHYGLKVEFIYVHIIQSHSSHYGKLSEGTEHITYQVYSVRCVFTIKPISVVHTIDGIVWLSFKNANHWLFFWVR